MAEENNEDLIESIKLGNEKAMEKLCFNNKRLICSIAKSFRTYIGFDWDDAIQEGYYAIMLAANAFEPSRGSFTTLASLYIRRQMRYYVSSNIGMASKPNIAMKILKCKSMAHKISESEIPTEDSIQKVAKVLDVTEDFVKISISAVNLFYGHSIDAPDAVDETNPEGETVSLLTALAGPDNVEKIAEKSSLRAAILSVISSMPERNQEIVRKKWGLNGGKQYKLGELSKAYGMSKQRVQQIVDRARQLCKNSDDLRECFC